MEKETPGAAGLNRMGPVWCEKDWKMD